MAFRLSALAALLSVACALNRADPGGPTTPSKIAKCELTFKVVYPEGTDPYPICSNHCPARVQGCNAQVWYDGVAYKQFCDLDRYNMMVKATFKNGELVGCKMVPLVSELLTSDVWIGLNDVEVEGSFRNPGRHAVYYTNWADGQPNYGYGRNEDCTMMVRRLGFSWIDANCDNQRRVLCESSAPPVEIDVSAEADRTENSAADVPARDTTERVLGYTCHKFDNSACFHVSGPNAKGNYSQAVDYCTSRGMTLASIHSQREQDFVRRKLTDSVWIGLHDPDINGHFRWLDGTPLDYTYFANNQPDIVTPSKDYVEIRKQYGYRWNNWHCHITLQYLCRM